MEKTLILVRHSKTEDRDSSVNEFERSLTPEGREDSAGMADFLKKKGIIPEFILDLIYGLPETIGCALVVAHNPGISDLSRCLTSNRTHFLENTQILILNYKMDHWFRIDETRPSGFETFPVSVISNRSVELSSGFDLQFRIKRGNR
jgi:phosphohistidine phosphatase SixA